MRAARAAAASPAASRTCELHHPQGHPGRRRHGRRQRRRGGGAALPATRCGGPSSTATSCEGLAAEARQRRAVPAHGGTALGTGRGEQITPVLGTRRVPLGVRGRRRGLSTPAVYAELDRLRGGGAAAGVGAPGRRAGGAARGDTVALGPRARQRPAAGGAVAAARSCAACSTRAASSARSAPSSPAPGRPARSSRGRAHESVRIASALAGSGVCRTVRRADGPVPGAASSPATALTWPGRTWSTSRTSRKSYGTRRRARRRLARRRGRRADRRRRPQRRRQDDAAARCSPASSAGQRPGHPHRRPAGRAAGQRDDLDPARTVRDVVVGDGRSTSGPATRASARCSRGLLRRRRPRPRRRPAVRWRAAPGRAGRAAGRDHDLLVLDEPTNHLDIEAIAWLAGIWLRAGAARWSSSRTTGGSSTRCASRPGRSPTGGRSSYDGGYAAYVLARAERERQAAAGEDAPAEPAAQGAGLAAARTAGPHVEAAVPHRRRERADRRRAAAARRRRAAARSPPRGSARTSYDVEDVDACGSATATLLDDVTWRLGPGDRVGLRRRQRRGQDDAAAAARR